MHCADEPTGRPRYSWGTGRSRNVRAPQSRAVANGHPGRPAGQCHREQTACRATRPVRVKRWGKSPPAPQATAAARQTPPGARPRSRRPRAARPSLRVGRVSPPATAGQDGWSPPPHRQRSAATEPGVQVGSSAPPARAHEGAHQVLPGGRPHERRRAKRPVGPPAVSAGRLSLPHLTASA